MTAASNLRGSTLGLTPVQKLAAAGVAGVLCLAACGAGGGKDGSDTASGPTASAPAVGPPPAGLGLPEIVPDFEGLPGGVETQVVELPDCRVEVTLLSDEIGFARDSDVLNQAGLDAIVAMADPLRQAVSIDVVGHTSTEGDAAYNQGLSERRANAVGTEIGRVLPGWGGRIRPTGKGETQPVINPDTTEDERRRNRRVVITPTYPPEVCTSDDATTG